MPTYRLLSPEELQELEKEFVEYLVLNGITADDWERMKERDNEGVDRIIELFSDVVFEGILRKVHYLEYKAESFVHVFQCLGDSLVLVAMEAEEDDVNFLDSTFIQQATISPPENLVIRTTTKAYSKTRELELFDMISAGCTISDGGLFKTLCMNL